MSQNQATGQVQVVTTDDLRKSLEALEGKTPEPQPAKVEVKVEKLGKSVADTLKTSSESLRKALDVSEVLGDFAGAIGTHVDSAIEVMEKNVQAQAENQNAVVRVLETLAKSMNDLREEVKLLGKQPGPAAVTQNTAGTTTTEVLEKSATGGSKVDPKQARTALLSGLETLIKSMPAGSPDANKYIQAVSKFESTGKIEDSILQQALKASGK